MHELFIKFSSLVIEKTENYNWEALFNLYDKNSDALLDKIELKGMLIDSGLKDVTDAEVGFAYNVMSFF